MSAFRLDLVILYLLNKAYQIVLVHDIPYSQQKYALIQADIFMAEAHDER